MAIFCCWSSVSLVLLLTVIAALVGVTVIVGGVQTSCWDELEFAASTSILPKLSLHHHHHQQQLGLLPCSIEVITSETMNSVGISELQLPITRQGRRRRRRRRNRKLLLIESDSSSMSRQKDKSLLEYQLPRRSVTTTSAFGTDRLVPTGPNPLHNSNTTQIWYP
ncbi:unnamed protein product [Sphagnum jensenii]|uniref:Uncharacterized protein n=1 Tax=Sphagnum jensenii TaxID=128206 RepID=A0ABP0X2L0_9BRYO